MADLSREAVVVLDAVGNGLVDAYAIELGGADAIAAIAAQGAVRQTVSFGGTILKRKARQLGTLPAIAVTCGRWTALPQAQARALGSRAHGSRRTAVGTGGGAVTAREAPAEPERIIVRRQTGEPAAAVVVAGAALADHGLGGRLRRVDAGRGLDAQAVIGIADAVTAIAPQRAVGSTETALLQWIAGKIRTIATVAGAERRGRARFHAVPVGI